MIFGRSERWSNLDTSGLQRRRQGNTTFPTGQRWQAGGAVEHGPRPAGGVRGLAVREPAKRSPVTPPLPPRGPPARSPAPAQRPLTARSPRQRGRRPPAPQGAGEGSGRPAAPHGRGHRSRPAPVRGRRCRLPRQAGARKVPPGAGNASMPAPTGALVPGLHLEQLCLNVSASSFPCLGTRKDPQAEARSDGTAISPQLSVPFITKKHTGLAEHGTKYGSPRFGAGPGGKRSQQPALRPGEPLGSSMAGPGAGSAREPSTLACRCPSPMLPSQVCR